MALSSSTPASTHALDPLYDSELTAARARRRERLGGRNLWSAIAFGGGFLGAATACAAWLPAQRAQSLWVYALLIGVYALVSRVDFEVGAGSAVPTTLVLVPMLFVLPLRSVPCCVGLAMLLRELPEILRGRSTLEREFLRLVNCWHALGPVLVLAAAGPRTPRLGDAPVYAAALAAQFGLDFASSAARERVANGLPPQTLFRFISWAWLVDLAIAPIGLAVAVVATSHPTGVLLVLPLVGLLGFFARERTARIDQALELSHAYRGTALLLGDVVEADHEYTGTHSREVVQLVLDVCDELGLSARERRDAEFAALLHDVGKIRIPAEIIDKPGPLTPGERAIIDTHTVEGERLLAQVGGLLGQVGRIVRSCHERWDGAGYPDGLAGEGIPRIARIVCACDAYSAMTTNRPYRAARTPGEAAEELRRSAGTHFDPAVVAALERVIASAASTIPAEPRNAGNQQ